jgi:hypothetical protein
MSNTISGTAKELVAKKLTIGGVVIDSSTLYALARLGIARKVTEKKSSVGRGKASSVFELDREIKLQLSAVTD